MSYNPHLILRIPEEDLTVNQMSGNVVLHWLIAFFFLMLGILTLFITYGRLLSLKGNVEQFMATFVPERNRTPVLRRFGFFMVAASTVASWVEYLSDRGRSKPMDHFILLLLLFTVGVVAVLESRGLLPVDTIRRAGCVACFCEYLLWKEHSLRKRTFIDQRVHEILGDISLFGAVCFMASVTYPNSFLLYLGPWASLTLQGWWFFVAGVNAGIVVIQQKFLGPALVVGIWLVCTLILGGTIHIRLVQMAHSDRDSVNDEDALGEQVPFHDDQPFEREVPEDHDQDDANLGSKLV